MTFWNKLKSVVGLGKKDTEELVTLPEVKVELEKEEKLIEVEVKEEVEFLSEIDALKQELSDAFEKLSSMDEYWEAIVAIEAVGVSCASSDRDFSDKERKEIRTFIESITVNKDVPSAVKEKIDELYQNPLPLNKAFLLAKDTKVEMSVFEDIIDSVMHVDGVKFEEKVVLNAWHDFKRSA